MLDTQHGLVATRDDGLVAFDGKSQEAYRAAGWWTGRTLPAELVAAAEMHGQRIALTTSEVTWSYRDVLDRSAAFASGLGKLAGLLPGDAVMFQMGNVAETIVAYLGCLLAGARPVCTLAEHGEREVGHVATHTHARFLISQADFRSGRLIDQARRLQEEGVVQSVIIARGTGRAGMLDFNDLVCAGNGVELTSLPYQNMDAQQIAVFQLSGGTTGMPKIAPRLHEEYTYNSRAWADIMDYGPQSVIMYPLPVMHNAGISLAVQPAVLSGARLVLAESADTDALIDLIERERPDILPLVPPAVAIRLLESPRARQADLSSVREFVVGGQTLSVEVAERLRDELGIEVRQMFGMAEGMFLVTPRDATEAVRHRTVGRPISHGDEVRILEPDTEIEVAPGEVGEFAARGPYTIRGYYRAEAHNAATFTFDGFYRTGDLSRCHFTAEGVVYTIEGRIKDVINRGGEKIHAAEVEELIVQHPSVVTAAVVAMPDPVLGEKACAYLVLEPGVKPFTTLSLAKYLRDQGIAKHKLPERVEIIPALPVTNVGKVSKKALREDVEAKLIAEAKGMACRGA